MNEYETLFLKISSALKNEHFNELSSKEKAYVLNYLKELKLVFEKSNGKNELLNNRICNDTIFTELVFDMILDSYNSDDKRLAFSYLGKETVRFKFFNQFVGDRNPLFQTMTQDLATKTLIEYKTSYMKSINNKEQSKYDFNGLNLSDRQVEILACLVCYEEELEINDQNKIMI